MVESLRIKRRRFVQAPHSSKFKEYLLIVCAHQQNKDIESPLKIHDMTKKYLHLTRPFTVRESYFFGSRSPLLRFLVVPNDARFPGGLTISQILEQVSLPSHVLSLHPSLLCAVLFVCSKSHTHCILSLFLLSLVRLVIESPLPSRAISLMTSTKPEHPRIFRTLRTFSFRQLSPQERSASPAEALEVSIAVAITARRT